MADDDLAEWVKNNKPVVIEVDDHTFDKIQEIINVTGPVVISQETIDFLNNKNILQNNNS